MIADSDVDRALQYLRDSASEAAIARANARYLESFLKSLRATLKLKSAASSNAAQEDEALASSQYLDALHGYKAAVEDDARHTFKREAADALIRAWQTQCSNLRSEGRAYGNG